MWMASLEELLEKKITSKAELETAQANFLQKKRAFESLSSQIINNEILIDKLEMTILESKQVDRQALSVGQLSIQEDLDRMQHAVRDWQQTFLIAASISGKIALNRFWSTQQSDDRNIDLYELYFGFLFVDQYFDNTG